MDVSPRMVSAKAWVLVMTAPNASVYYTPQAWSGRATPGAPSAESPVAHSAKDGGRTRRRVLGASHEGHVFEKLGVRL